MSDLVPKSSCTVSAVIEITGDLNEYGTPSVLFSGNIKGHWQVSNIEQLNGTERLLVQQGSFLTPAESIPENLNYNGGKITLKGQVFEIGKVIPNYDLYGKLDYWRITTE